MTDHLEEILLRQYALQRLRGHDLAGMGTAARVEYIRLNNQAAVAELVEALDEVSWKPWATGGPWINRERLVDELVDVLCFLANQLLAAGVGAAELNARHAAKSEINRRRYLDGYRARNDPAADARGEVRSAP